MQFNHSISQLKAKAKELLIGKSGTMALAVLISTLIPSVAISVFQMVINPNNIVSVFIYLIAVIAISLLSYVFYAGVTGMVLKVSRRQNISVGNVFYMFTDRPDRYIGSGFLVSILTSLPALPGIIVMISAIPYELIYKLATYSSLSYSNEELFLNGISYSDALNMANLILGMIPMFMLGFLLSMIGYVFSLWISLMYELTTYILIDNPDMRVIEALKASRLLTKGHRLDLFVLILSFIGWIILSIFTFGILLLWVMPYMQTTISLFYFDLTKEPVRENPANAPFIS